MVAQVGVSRRTALGLLAFGAVTAACNRLEGPQPQIASGVGGSEKGDFFRDAEVIEALKRTGWAVTYEESGSRTLAVLQDRTYDFAFPAGTAAEEKIRREPTTFNKPFSAQQFLTFSSLLVLGTFKEIADVFVDVGVARREGTHIVLDLRQYLDRIAIPKRRWSDFPGVGKFSSPNQILIATTDPQESNSAAAFIALASYVLNDRDLVSDNAEADRWADIAAKAKTGELKYGMTDPSQSNSGFAAIAGAATAFAGTGRALRAEEIDEARLADFLSGHELRAPTSGLLKTEFLKAPDRVDAMINYESVLLELNAELTDKLQLIYPSDGVVTADYPLLLFNDQRRPEYQAIVDWLTSPAIQKRIMDETGRRPIRPDVPLAERFNGRTFVPLPFPATFDTCKRLFSVYQNLGRLSHVIYALDLSGSMAGDRLARLKAAFVDLTGGDTSISGQFNHFRRNERITILTFSDRVLDEKQFVIDDPTPDSASYRAIRDYVEGLSTGGDTAIYTAAARAYKIAEAAIAANADYLTTVVLLSDGENNSGIGAQEFLAGVPQSVRHVRTFAVLFGEAKPEELTVVTAETRGELIDANATSLVEAFKTIRGYQ